MSPACRELRIEGAGSAWTTVGCTGAEGGPNSVQRATGCVLSSALTRKHELLTSFHWSSYRRTVEATFGGAQLTLTLPPDSSLVSGRDGALSRVRDGVVCCETSLQGPQSPWALAARTRNSYAARVRRAALVQHAVLSSSLALESNQRVSPASRHWRWNLHAPLGGSQSTAMLKALAAAATGAHDNASDGIERASSMSASSLHAFRKLSEMRFAASTLASVCGCWRACSRRSSSVLIVALAFVSRAFRASRDSESESLMRDFDLVEAVPILSNVSGLSSRASASSSLLL
eukprot:scaffold60393_cov28-Tisochrysis_lutea.AAC.2